MRPNCTAPLTKRLKMPAMPLRFALALIALSFAGCAAVSRPSQVERLLQHPEFSAAARAAPNFTSEVLHALADAEQRAK